MVLKEQNGNNFEVEWQKFEERNTGIVTVGKYIQKNILDMTFK